MTIKVCKYNYSESCIISGDSELFPPRELMCKECLKIRNKQFYKNNVEALNLRERSKAYNKMKKLQQITKKE